MLGRCCFRTSEVGDNAAGSGARGVSQIQERARAKTSVTADGSDEAICSPGNDLLLLLRLTVQSNRT